MCSSWPAWAKIADPEGTRRGIQGFGLSNRAAWPLGILLPLAELGTAILLIPVSTVWWASVGAIALFFVFDIVIGISLVRGRHPSCHCFGQLHAEPVGWPTLIRNGILAGCACFVLWDASRIPPVSVIAWTNALAGPEVLIRTLGAVFIVAEGWITLHLLRQNGRLLLRMDALEAERRSGESASPPAAAPAGLPIGTRAPTFELSTLPAGSVVSLDTLMAERRPIVLIFSDPACGPCASLLPDVARWEREYTRHLTFALVSRGSEQENRGTFGAYRLDHVFLQQHREVAEAYRATGTPSAVLIGGDGLIGSPLVVGAEAIAGLVAATARMSALSSLPANGTQQNGHASRGAGRTADRGRCAANQAARS